MVEQTPEHIHLAIVRVLLEFSNDAVRAFRSVHAETAMMMMMPSAMTLDVVIIDSSALNRIIVKERCSIL